jgi:hypothetical protein
MLAIFAVCWVCECFHHDLLLGIAVICSAEENAALTNVKSLSVELLANMHLDFQPFFDVGVAEEFAAFARLLGDHLAFSAGGYLRLGVGAGHAEDIASSGSFG